MTVAQLTYATYFKNIVQIGSGSYGEVFRCIDRVSNNRVVIKVMKSEDASEGVGGATIREISILQRLRHANIVQFRKILHIEDKPVLVLEECDTDLRQYMGHHGALVACDIHTIMLQLLAAVGYLHENSVIHRDLKPENILLIRQPLQVKLADFGLARCYGYARNHTVRVVTLHYRAPEILNAASAHTTAIDMWSIGCIWCEMVFGRVLFKGKSEIDELNAIEGGVEPLRDAFAPEEFVLLQRMLNMDSEQRPTCQEALDLLCQLWGCDLGE